MSVCIVWRAGLLYVIGQLWFHSYSKQNHPKCQRCFHLHLMHCASFVFSFFLFFNARLSQHFNKSQNESFLISLYVFKATESPGMRMKKGQIDRRLTLTGIGINCFTRRKQHPVLNKGVHHVLMFLFMAPAKIILNSQARQSERKCLECAVEAN